VARKSSDYKSSYNSGIINWWELKKVEVTAFFSDITGQIQARLPWTWLTDLLAELLDKTAETDEEIAEQLKKIKNPEEIIDETLADLFPEPGVEKGVILKMIDDEVERIGSVLLKESEAQEEK